MSALPSVDWAEETSNDHARTRPLALSQPFAVTLSIVTLHLGDGRTCSAVLFGGVAGSRVRGKARLAGGLPPHTSAGSPSASRSGGSGPAHRARGHTAVAPALAFTSPRRQVNTPHRSFAFSRFPCCSGQYIQVAVPCAPRGCCPCGLGGIAPGLAPDSLLRPREGQRPRRGAARRPLRSVCSLHTGARALPPSPWTDITANATRTA